VIRRKYGKSFSFSFGNRVPKPNRGRVAKKEQ